MLVLHFYNIWWTSYLYSPLSLHLGLLCTNCMTLWLKYLCFHRSLLMLFSFISFGTLAVDQSHIQTFSVLLGFRPAPQSTPHLLGLHWESCWCRVMAVGVSTLQHGVFLLYWKSLNQTPASAADVWQRSSGGTATEPLNSATSRWSV